ncbi:MAG TPA: adenylate/guanylate cyclase domain-containing protein [Pseudonocardia sp.]|uniref:adenylate/guanylate cyclase domain-containing protein n=1 Tax=Pseudonocardia sp. TaxID=60912 RepID=UPI002F3F94DC
MTPEVRALGQIWRARLGRLLPGGSSGDENGDADIQQRLEELLLGGSRRYSRAQLIEQASVDADLTKRIWRSLGFAEVGDDEVVFTDGDRQALRTWEDLRADGLVPAQIEDSVARSVGQAMSGLADWQVETIYQLVDHGHDEIDERELMEIAARILPLMRQMQSYIWRRQLAAAAGRLLTGHPHNSQTRSLVVGFADMVDFTKASHQLSLAGLAELIEQFHRTSNEVVASCRGRVVKTVGDEVLFTTSEAPDGAEIALALLEQLAATPGLPELRIGLAVGPVVTRFGDVYGEPVNIAARLTSHARPGRTLVDRNLAAALEDDDRFTLRGRRPLAVRGYRHLLPWELSRSKRRSTPGSSPGDPDRA